MVESRKQSLGPQAQPGADTGQLWGTTPDRLLAIPTWSLSATLYLLPSLYFTIFLHQVPPERLWEGKFVGQTLSDLCIAKGSPPRAVIP